MTHHRHQPAMVLLHAAQERRVRRLEHHHAVAGKGVVLERDLDALVFQATDNRLGEAEIFEQLCAKR